MRDADCRRFMVMHSALRIRLGLLFWLLFDLGLSSNAAQSPGISLVRTPNGGIQPQAVVDRLGVIHLIYYKGEPAGGDIFYVHQSSRQGAFSAPVRVNTEAGSATALGTIRGGQLALGRNGLVHVAWNGHAPKDGSFLATPMLYARLNETRTAFEPERNLITTARGLDGGGSVAADAQGNVYVFWHAPRPGNTNGEAGRALFVAHSADDGRTFAPEIAATPERMGACACCGMKALADSAGNLVAFYRAAADSLNRDETLLLSRNHGADFRVIYTHGWKIPSCPMSSAFLSEYPSGILAAAETHGRVFFVRVSANTGQVSEPVSPPDKGKHPVAVSNGRGDVLLAWAEGTGWGQGGSVAWQLYTAGGTAASESRRMEGVPPWSLVAAVPRPDGSFVIFY